MEKISNYICHTEQAFERLSDFVKDVRGVRIEHEPGRGGEVRVQISAIDAAAWERVFLRVVKDPEIVGAHIR